jgi:hypothetical protein
MDTEKKRLKDVQLNIPVEFNYVSIMGYLFMDTRWFRNSRIGWKWACKYHPEVVVLDEYLLWQLFYIR